MSGLFIQKFLHVCTHAVRATAIRHELRIPIQTAMICPGVQGREYVLIGLHTDQFAGLEIEMASGRADRWGIRPFRRGKGTPPHSD